MSSLKETKSWVRMTGINPFLFLLSHLQCHYSYSACGLGTTGTDKLVELVQEMQHQELSQSGSGTLYGAKITGGGSGGTVCIIGRNCMRSSEQILQVLIYFSSVLVIGNWRDSIFFFLELPDCHRGRIWN